MRKISVTMFMTLDGVVQGLGRPDEDTRGDFPHGGWGPRFNDDVMGQELGKGMAQAGDLLFGRRTWQDFANVWGRATDGNPFSALMNKATKYVVSRTLDDAGAWENSTLLRGDAVETVSTLKETDGPDLAVNGSAALVRSLHAAGLVDDYTLLIHPLTLGTGARLFEHPAPLAEFELISSVATTKGVLIVRYRRAES